MGAGSGNGAPGAPGPLLSPEGLMREALRLAAQAAEEGEVPVGAVVARQGRIVGRGRNRRERGRNALAHAELEAIDEACRTLGGWRLFGCELYVTLEPCPMCAGAIINARLDKVVFGAADPKAGSCGSVVDLFALPYNHRPACEGGFLREECAAQLTGFFRSLREQRSVLREQRSVLREQRDCGQEAGSGPPSTP